MDNVTGSLVNCVYEPFSVNYLTFFHFAERSCTGVVRVILVPDLRLHVCDFKLGIKITDKVCFCKNKDCIFIFAPGSGPGNTSVLTSERMCVISNFLKSRMLQGFGLRPATLCALGPLARGPPRSPLRSDLPSPGGQPTDELFVPT